MSDENISSFRPDDGDEQTRRLGSVPLLLALACTALFGAAAWWSWRAGTLLEPLTPAQSVSTWNRLTSPLEWNAFERLPVVTGDVDGTFAVGQHVWVVGASGLILHSTDGGQTWERQQNVAWAPRREAGPPEPQRDAAEPFGLVRNAYAMEPPSSSPRGERGKDPRATGSRQEDVRPSGAGDAAPTETHDAAPSGSSDGGAASGAPSAEKRAEAKNLKRITPRRYVPKPPTKQPPAQVRNSPEPPAENAKPTAAEETKTATPPGPVDLHAVAFVDERVGVIVGDGVILRTNDGGSSWAAVEKPETGALRAVAFVNGGHAVAVGDTATVLRSDDDGRTWEAVADVPTTRDANFRSVACVESGLCPMVGDRGTFEEYSLDGRWGLTNRTGLTGVDLRAVTTRNSNEYVAVGGNLIAVRWGNGMAPHGAPTLELVPIPNVFGLTGVRFADPQHGVALGTYGAGSVIVRTDDGGKTWTTHPVAARELTSLAIVDANVMVAVGIEGAVLRTADGGVTWTSVVRGNGSLVAVRFADDDHAVAVGGDGTMLRSRDRGRTWAVPAGNPSARLSAITFTAGGRAVAVGPTGTVVRSDDRGDHWQTAFSDPKISLAAVAFGDADHGLAVGEDGAVLRTADGGKTWSATDTAEFLLAVAFGDVRHAVAVGATIQRSSDGGATWHGIDYNVDAVLQSVAFAPTDPRRVIAVGTVGTIVLSSDGGETWRQQKSNASVTLREVAFVDARHVVAVGDGGTVLHSADGGETWTPKERVATQLSSVDFSDPERGIAVGEGGTILASRDGGETWSEVRYTRYPAPLFLALTIAAVGFGLAWAVYAWREPPVEQRKASVTDLLGSDRPLRPGDHGAARLAHIASGISRFIRNRNTQPPLTIAITGEWGTGKSSLMSLLYEELAGRGFRPVWFNAWHHQHGEQLLASLYANIRAQGIPPFFSLEGLDFRYDLLRIRARRSWVRVALMLLAMGFALNYVRCHAESGQFLVGLAGLTADKLLEQAKHATAFAGVVLPVAMVLQALRAFGVDPKTLLGVVRLERDRAVSAMPGARFRFASEFKDVTEALKPRPLVIFIDDLDRCSPDNVLEVLETVNFLVSEGDCYIVLGLSRPWVEAAVGLGFEQIAAETVDPAPAETPTNGDGARPSVETDPRDKRRRFARHYLEKLVNVEVPVPALDDSASKDILTPDAAEKPPWRARALAQAGRVLAQSWLPLLAVATVAGGWYLAPRAPDLIPTHETASSTAPAVPRTPTVVPVAPPSAPLPSGPTRTGERRTTPARFLPGATDTLARLRVLVPGVFGMLALLTLVIVLVVRRARVETDDSNEFRDALKIMRPWIVIGHPTPRLLKRYVNHVRFIAMRQRTDPDPESLGQRLVRRAKERLWGTKPPAPVQEESALFLKEPQLVALSALHQSRADWQTCPDWLQRFYEKLKQGELREAIRGREIDAKDLKKILEELGKAISAYNGTFKSYALFVTEEADRAAISALIETMAGVRVEWTEGHETTSVPSGPASADGAP